MVGLGNIRRNRKYLLHYTWVTGVGWRLQLPSGRTQWLGVCLDTASGRSGMRCWTDDLGAQCEARGEAWWPNWSWRHHLRQPWTAHMMHFSTIFTLQHSPGSRGKNIPERLKLSAVQWIVTGHGLGNVTMYKDLPHDWIWAFSITSFTWFITLSLPCDFLTWQMGQSLSQGSSDKATSVNNGPADLALTERTGKNLQCVFCSYDWVMTSGVDRARYQRKLKWT